MNGKYLKVLEGVTLNIEIINEIFELFFFFFDAVHLSVLYMLVMLLILNLTIYNIRI